MKNSKNYYSVGTRLYQDLQPSAVIIANAVNWLIKQKNSDGTWGGPDSLDRFISTNHVIMALQSVGYAPNSSLINTAIQFLIKLKTDKQVSFYWRAGSLLNITKYHDVVIKDMEYIWSFRNRIGVHKDYPLPFFLLKLLQFISPTPQLNFSKDDVLRWVLNEWSEAECWYNRTSITSMALALIHDMNFSNKKHIIEHAREFLESKFVDLGETGYFNPNLLEDAFLIFNLCERDILDDPRNSTLNKMVTKCTKRLL